MKGPIKCIHCFFTHGNASLIDNQWNPLRFYLTHEKANWGEVCLHFIWSYEENGLLKEYINPRDWSNGTIMYTATEIIGHPGPALSLVLIR